jgi:hypothetical protein
MLFHRITYRHPFVLVPPIALIEFKTYAPTVVIRSFDAPRLMAAIIAYVGDRSFYSRDLMKFAHELTQAGSEEMRLAIGDIDTPQLGAALRAIADEGKAFGGCRLECIDRDMYGSLWRIYPS